MTGRVMSFGQRYQIDAEPEPEPQADVVEPDPGVVLVPPIVLEAVKVPVVLEVDPSSIRQVADAICAIIRSAVTDSIIAGFQDASQIELVDDGDPSSDRSA